MTFFKDVRSSMAELKSSNELLDVVSKVLLRCAVLGFLLLFLWFGVYLLAPAGLRGGLCGLTPHEVDVVHYCGIGFTKILVLVFFVFPYISIRLVLSRKTS